MKERKKLEEVVAKMAKYQKLQKLTKEAVKAGKPEVKRGQSR